MRIEIDLPETLLRQVEISAARQGLAPAALIAQFVAQGIQEATQRRPRSAPPMIAKAATGKPIPAMTADVLKTAEAQEDLDKYTQSIQGSR
ncbi:MAG: hypothetical protein WAU00_00665 [Caldilinea sp.]|uniref:hypothetical protein n=1 Tax=Caldilinea sp. TaxID=2293560 RepID=UPI002B5BCD15|nr:hypothetical protein [Anaerolineales bacterium]HQY92800.1 hypothetical protein [Caldilinea sp.]HRA67983.1 hypothetical protein [Caldilinea sp.]